MIAVENMDMLSRVRTEDMDLDPRISEYVERAGAIEGTLSILVDLHDASKVLKVGSPLTAELREQLVNFLWVKLDVFVSSYDNMVGIDPDVMCHRLNIDPTKKGVRQKKKASEWREGGKSSQN